LLKKITNNGRLGKDKEVLTAMQVNHDIVMTSQALDEIKNELYKRLEDSRATLIAFETGD
jgi:hypothetical protein